MRAPHPPDTPPPIITHSPFPPRCHTQVQAWQREKKNLRALLASLHEIAPPCSWTPHTLAQLIDSSAVKKAYRKALLAVHPDKQDGGDVEAKVLAQHVFDALRDAWNIFEKTG